MFIYVCYFDYGRDGLGTPQVAFYTEKEAVEWCRRYGADYSEIRLGEEE